MDNKTYIVKNRSASIVGYKIPELGIRREFGIGESKKIGFEELEKLTFQPGGRELLESFLQVTADKVINNLNLHTEPEYFMSEQQVVDLIKTGSQEAFLDALDYAPLGVMDLIKRFAVELPMNDINKIAALKEKTGFDVAAALANKKAEEAEDTANEVNTDKAATNNTKTTSGRRTTTNYKVVEEEAPKTPEYKIVDEVSE